MPTRRIPIEKAPLWIRTLADERRKDAMRGLLSAATRLVGAIQNEIIPEEPRIPVDRGIYRSGWGVRATPHGAELYNDTPHAGFIEDGVRGDHVKIGRAMLEALTQWVQRKMGGGDRAAKPGRDIHGRYIKAMPAKTAPKGSTLDARKVAWAIAKSMQKNGIFNRGGGLKIMDKAVKRYAKRFIEEEVRRELQRGSGKGGE